jgi:hypothetical protein
VQRVLRAAVDKQQQQQQRKHIPIWSKLSVPACVALSHDLPNHTSHVTRHTSHVTGTCTYFPSPAHGCKNFITRKIPRPRQREQHVATLQCRSDSERRGKRSALPLNPVCPLRRGFPALNARLLQVQGARHAVGEGRLRCVFHESFALVFAGAAAAAAAAQREFDAVFDA